MMIGINRSEKQIAAKALSLSLMAFNMFSTTGVVASDLPLAIKKIGLNTDDQVVILFGSRPGAFPNPPKVLELKGPNHRIVLDFQDTNLDKINMPTSEDLSEKMHKLFPAITGVNFMKVANGAHPLARVIIEVPEELVIEPKVVKLDEDSVTLSLGDDIAQAASELPTVKTWTDPPGVKPPPKKGTKPAALLVVPASMTIATSFASTSSDEQELLAQAAAAASPNNAWDWSQNISGSGQTEKSPANTPVAGTNPAAVVAAPSANVQQPNVVAPADNGLGMGELRPSHGTMEVQESTQTFSEPATMLQPGAQQVVTEGAAAMMKKPEKEEEVKSKTVAEIDNNDFRKVMTPDPAPKQNVAEAADQPLQLKPPLPTEDSSATSMDATPAKDTPAAVTETKTVEAAPAATETKAVEAAPAVTETRAVETAPPVTETKVMEAAPAAAPAAVTGKVAPTEAEAQSPLEVAPAKSSVKTSETTSTPAAPAQASDDMAATADEAASKTDTGAAVPTTGKAQAALALYNAAVKAHLQGKLQEAITDYKGALAANPSLSEAYSNLGLIYNQQHNYGQAIAEFRKALAINPKDAITYNGIGAALRAEKDLPGAIKQWQTAVTLDPRLATAHYNLGTAYEIQREYEKALDSYKAAVKNDYRLGEAYYRMGIILVRSKRSEEAAEQFKTALKISKDSEYSEDARKRLALIEGASAAKVK
jgi:Tfp pilus assembly protein PilF